MTREQELAREGWERRATYDEPRLSEMVTMYREIGLEVHLEPLDANEPGRCRECLMSNPERFKTIYVRRNVQPRVPCRDSERMSH